MNDKEILHKIKSKDHEAFRLLLEKYQAMIINTCMGYVHNHEEAEDIAQEVLRTVLNRVEGDASPHTAIDANVRFQIQFEPLQIR